MKIVLLLSFFISITSCKDHKSKLKGFNRSGDNFHPWTEFASQSNIIVACMSQTECGAKVATSDSQYENKAKYEAYKVKNGSSKSQPNVKTTSGDIKTLNFTEYVYSLDIYEKIGNNSVPIKI